MSKDDYRDGFYTYKRNRNDEEETELIDIPLDEEYEEDYDFDYIEFEETDENQPSEKPFDNYEKNIRSGEFEVKEIKEHYVSTYLFFPVALLLMETVIKISCGMNFLNGILYFIAFPFAIGTLLTLICTMSKKAKKNRTIAKIILFIITLIYEIQLLYYMIYNTMLDIDIIKSMSFEKFNDIVLKIPSLKTRGFIISFIIILLPLVVLFVCGKRFFPFVRAPFISKGLLIGVVVLLSVLIFLGIQSTKEIKDDKASYKVMLSDNQKERTEKFGILASQGMDVYNEFVKK